MKYPTRLWVRPAIGRGFVIDVREEDYPVDSYIAANPEELLVFLMGVYDWYPKGYETACDGVGFGWPCSYTPGEEK